MDIYRGSIVDIRYELDIDPSIIDHVEIVLSQNKAIIKNWTLGDCTLGDGTLTITADQAITLALEAREPAYFQMRISSGVDVNVSSVNKVNVKKWLGPNSEIEVEESGTSENRKTIVFAETIGSEEYDISRIAEVIEEMNSKKGELDAHVGSATDTTDETLMGKLNLHEADLEDRLDAKKTELEQSLESELDTYVTDTVKPALDVYRTDTVQPAIDSYVGSPSDSTESGTIMGNLNARLVELESALEDKEESLEGTLDSYEASKERELDTYTEGKIEELYDYTIARKGELDSYEDIKEEELETFASRKKGEITDLAENERSELDSYTTEKKSELDTYEDRKEGELDSYVEDTTKPSIDFYVENTSKPALDSYETEKESELDTKTENEKSELDSYTTEKKSELDTYTTTKEAEIASATDTEVARVQGVYEEDLGALGNRIGNIDWEKDPLNHAIVEEVKEIKEEIVDFVENSVSSLKWGDVLAEKIEAIRLVEVPETSTSAGNAGDVAISSDYVYICIAQSSWKRMSLENF